MASGNHSAIPSWSGYIYQGKVAIYHTLSFIVEKLNSNKNYDFTSYSLEVEWAEDFALKNGNDYLSLHQVKAYKETKPSTYKDALEDIYTKLATTQYAKSKAYLHIWQSITYNGSTSDFEKLKQNYQKSHSADVLKRMELYEYEKDKFNCGLSEIDTYILEKIKSYIQLINDPNIPDTDEQYTRTKENIFALLDKHILAIHSGSTRKTDTIPFDSILCEMIQNHEESSQPYKELKLKSYILEMIAEYCDDPDSCLYKTCDDSCHFFPMIKIFEAMRPSELFKFIKRASPQFTIDELQNAHGIKYSLFAAYYEFDKSKRCIDHIYSKDTKFFLPSTIHGRKDSKSIAYKLLKNKELDNLIDQFQINIFISEDITIKQLATEALKLNSIDKKQLHTLYDSHDKNKINQIKELTVLSIEDVKKEL